MPEEAAEGLEILPGTLVLAFSPLLGYGLQTLLKKLPEDSLVFAVECDDALFDFSAPFVEEATGQAAPCLPSGRLLAGERSTARERFAFKSAQGRS